MAVHGDDTPQPPGGGRIGRAASRSFGSLLLVAVLAVLVLAREVLIPLAAAGLLALLLTPAVGWLVRRRVPDLVATLAVVGGLALALVLTAWLIVGQLDSVVRQLPEYRHNLHLRLGELMARGETMALAAETIDDLRNELSGLSRPATAAAVPARDLRPVPVSVVDDGGRIQDIVAVLTTTLRPIATLGIILLLTAFMIVQRDDLRRRIGQVAQRLDGDGRAVLSPDALSDIGDRIGRYLIIQSLLNLASGAVIGLGLLALGVPNAFLWGLLSCLLRYVPFLGNLICGGLTVLFVIAISPDWRTPLLVIGLFILVEAAISNIAEPLFFAQGAGLTSLAVLVAAGFWTWIWGLAGLFLAVPLTVCLVVVGKRVPSLDYLHIMLAREARDRPPRPPRPSG